MRREPIARISAEAFDRARMEILRDLAGIEPARDAPPDRWERCNQGRKEQPTVWSPLIGSVALK